MPFLFISQKPLEEFQLNLLNLTESLENPYLLSCKVLQLNNKVCCLSMLSNSLIPLFGNQSAEA